LIGIPRFIIETDDKDPEKVLLECCEKTFEKKNESFLEDFKKVRAIKLF